MKDFDGIDFGFFGYKPSNSILEKSESVELVRNPGLGFSPVLQIQTLILDFGISRFYTYDRSGGKYWCRIRFGMEGLGRIKKGCSSWKIQVFFILAFD